VKSKNGEMSVNIDSDNESSVIVEQSSKSNAESTVTIDKAVKGASNSEAVVQNDEDEHQEKDTEKEFSFVEFVKKQLSFLREIITFKYLFGDK
jgi:hypothetical protein